MPRPKVGQEVEIKDRHRHELTEGGFTYEIDPTKYGGPWELPPGTVLKIVKVPVELSDSPTPPSTQG